MEPSPDADNQSILAAVQIGEAVSFKAFNACTKNGHTTIAVVPKALAEMASGIQKGDFWQAKFTPYDLNSARLISPLPTQPDDWPVSTTHATTKFTDEARLINAEFSLVSTNSSLPETC